MENLEKIIRENEGAFYVFDIQALHQRIQYLKAALPDDVDLCYAVKANPFIVKATEPMVSRLEICSPGEYTICKEAGIPTHKMVISGIYKSDEFIQQLIEDPDFKGIITVESVGQYNVIRTFSEKTQRCPMVLLRLTNHSQFGINESEILEIIEEEKHSERMKIQGIQYFSGTQKTSLKKYKREIESLDQFLSRIEQICGVTMEELEYGTGFPVHYFNGKDFDEDDFLSEFSNLLTHMEQKPKITLEIGRSMAACCGNYYTHVVDVKTNKSQNYALVDGGMHHIVYFGQHMAMSVPPVEVIKKDSTLPTSPWTVCGSLCSMNDILVKQAMLPDLKKGDTLCFKNTGAYCMTEGMALFLSRDLPAVYLRDGETYFQARPQIQTAPFNTIQR